MPLAWLQGLSLRCRLQATEASTSIPKRMRYWLIGLLRLCLRSRWTENRLISTTANFNPQAQAKSEWPKRTSDMKPLSLSSSCGAVLFSSAWSQKSTEQPSMPIMGTTTGAWSQLMFWSQVICIDGSKTNKQDYDPPLRVSHAREQWIWPADARRTSYSWSTRQTNSRSPLRRSQTIQWWKLLWKDGWKHLTPQCWSLTKSKFPTSAWTQYR